MAVSIEGVGVARTRLSDRVTIDLTDVGMLLFNVTTLASVLISWEAQPEQFTTRRRQTHRMFLMTMLVKVDIVSMKRHFRLKENFLLVEQSPEWPCAKWRSRQQRRMMILTYLIATRVQHPTSFESATTALKITEMVSTVLTTVLYPVVLP